MSTTPSPVAEPVQSSAVTQDARGVSQTRRLALLGRFGMVGILIIVVIAAQVVYSRFLALSNISDLLQNDTPVGLVAIGMTFVLIGGGFDLSVGGSFAAAGMLYATLANHMPVGVAFILMLPIGVAMGMANGLVITRLRVNAFVATLGSASVFSGIAYLVNTNGAVSVTAGSFGYLGNAKWLSIPVMIWILAVAFLVGAILLSKTVYGRSVYIVGGNPEAARVSGMRVSLIQGSTYVITAVCAALAGMLLASQTDVGQANVGANTTLDSIAIVIIGGTSLRGGQGAMWRTLIGLLIIASIDNLFSAMAWNSAVQDVTKGLIVIGAVALDAWTQRRATLA